MHPKHFSCSEYSKQFKVVLQNTRIQTRGPNAGGDIFTILHSGHRTHAYFLFSFYLLINQIYVPHTNVVQRKAIKTKNMGTLNLNTDFLDF